MPLSAEGQPFLKEKSPWSIRRVLTRGSPGPPDFTQTPARRHQTPAGALDSLPPGDIPYAIFWARMPCRRSRFARPSSHIPRSSLPPLDTTSLPAWLSALPGNLAGSASALARTALPSSSSPSSPSSPLPATLLHCVCAAVLAGSTCECRLLTEPFRPADGHAPDRGALPPRTGSWSRTVPPAEPGGDPADGQGYPLTGGSSYSYHSAGRASRLGA